MNASAVIGALRVWMTTDPTLVGLVSDRISPLRSAQGKPLPRITLEPVSAERVRSLQGTSGLVHRRVRIACWAATYDAAERIAEAVRTLVESFAGGQSGIDFDFFGVAEQSSDLVEPADASDEPIHLSALELDVWHNERKRP